MQTRVSKVETWMTQNKLKMNDKTGSPHGVKLTFFLLLTVSSLLFVLALSTFGSWPTVLATLVSWFQITGLLTSTFQLTAVLFPWKRPHQLYPPVPVKQPKLYSVLLFPPNWTFIILFYLAAHFTFSVDYSRKFKSHQQNWFFKAGNCAGKGGGGGRYVCKQIVCKLSHCWSLSGACTHTLSLSPPVYYCTNCK